MVEEVFSPVQQQVSELETKIDKIFSKVEYLESGLYKNFESIDGKLDIIVQDSQTKKISKLENELETIKAEQKNEIALLKDELSELRKIIYQKNSSFGLNRSNSFS